MVCFGLTHDNGNSQELFVHPSVQVKGLHDHLVSFLEARVRGVTFLPQELPCAQERGRVFELPPEASKQKKKTRKEKESME